MFEYSGDESPFLYGKKENSHCKEYLDIANGLYRAVQNKKECGNQEKLNECCTPEGEPVLGFLSVYQIDDDTHKKSAETVEKKFEMMEQDRIVQKKQF